jgi:hypothetical protein
MNSLFSIHNASDGSIVLYLEEPEANLDLLEDVMAQVPMFHLARLRDHSGIDSMKSLDAARLLDKVRQSVPDCVVKVAQMSEGEALALAQALIDSVKFARAVAGRPVALELIK